ncbi:hypothetical protein TRFO_34130 [Tritrichomonas foetus]|uniref:Uncharacterized protein n=1 Tax=Tritrichomonas foetus TaxID=1144522 RepID=A0A1J4JJS0_9EUKA|nr:hypothetical protein TRFO_34130 [Tritrichomonas foetus]|eukprot:OHS99410.1 hypothetical protein TRFO_34130 [Tritrichomonas foetus]
MSSESSSVANLQKQINAIAEINVESSQNASDLLADINLLSPKSNSSPKSSNDSDEHLLDFLDDSQLLDMTPKSDKYGVSFSPPGSSFCLSNSNSPQSNSGDQDSDINAFITAFNTKYDLAACTLFDILDLVDSMLINTSKQPKVEEPKSKPKSETEANLIHQINALKGENSSIKNKLEEATNSMKNAQSLITTLEKQIEDLKATNAVLQNSNASLQKDNNDLHQSFNSIHTLMKNQYDDISVLSKQWTQMCEINRKQDALLEQYEQVNKTLQLQSKQTQQKPQVVTKSPEKKTNKRTEDEYYNIICSSIRIIEDCHFPDTLIREIHSIRDDSMLPLNERVISIMKSLASFVSIANEKAEKITQENQKALESQQILRNKCFEILSMFEEELNFLQNLSHSSDLQTITFSQGNGAPSPILSDEAKSELIKRCANLGRFVEETIGVISYEKFEESFEVPDGVDGTGIFELLTSAEISDRLSQLYARIDHENIEVREIFDMFIAQVFINNLLKNHTNELLMRISHCGREINSLRQELNDKNTDQEQTETMKKLIKHFRHRDSKLRKYLSKYIDVSQDDPTNEIVISLIESIGERTMKNTPLSKENEELKEELAHYKKQFEEFKEDMSETSQQKERNSFLENQNSEFQTQIKEYQAQIKQINHELGEKLEEINNLRIDNEEKSLRIEEFSSQIESAEQSHQNALREAHERIEFATSENNRMKQQIDSFESAMERVKKNRQQLGHEIERLKKINIQLQESLDTQHTKMKNEYMTQIRDLTEANEKYTRENSNLQSQIQILTAKNQQLTSENATLSIAKRSSDLKLRSIDEKINLEKRNLQSQYSAQVTASKVEQSKKLGELNSKIESAIDRISSLLNCDAAENLDQAVTMVEDELTKTRKSQYLYVQLLDNIQEAEKLLCVTTPERLVEAINDLVTKQNNNDRALLESERKAKGDRQELERLRKESKRCEGQVVSLKQWESWAKRIHRIIHEAEYVHLDSDQLRQALEEALLASVSSRTIFMRVESLRAQKNILEKYEKRLLYTRQGVRSSLRPVIAICLCIRRMQKFAGCLPISLAVASVTEIKPALKVQSAKKERMTPRKSKTQKSARKPQRSHKERGGCKSPLRPLIPMFV